MDFPYGFSSLYFLLLGGCYISKCIQLAELFSFSTILGNFCFIHLCKAPLIIFSFYPNYLRHHLITIHLKKLEISAFPFFQFQDSLLYNIPYMECFMSYFIIFLIFKLFVIEVNIFLFLLNKLLPILFCSQFCYFLSLVILLSK